MQLQTEPHEITELWQADIDQAMEAGRAPLLFVAHSSSPLNMLTGLLAFEQLAARRSDLSSPRAAVGGPSSLWLSTLALDRREQITQPMRPTYLGEDAATILASANLFAAQHGKAYRRLWSLPGNVPSGFAPFVLPASRPGEPVIWDALPFTRIRVPRTDGRVDGAALAALFLAIVLIFFALFL